MVLGTLRVQRIMMIASLLLFATAHAAPQTYELAPADSALYVVVYYERGRFSVVGGHDHTVAATSFAGSVTWDSDDLGACKVGIEFPVSELHIDPPGFREREKLDPEGAIGEGAKGTATGNMLGKGNLWADQFPSITYASSKCVAHGAAVDVTGTLTIRGVGKSLTVPMTVEVSPESFHARGTAELTHGDFGMDPFTYGPGTPKNAERLKLVIDVSGTPIAG